MQRGRTIAGARVERRSGVNARASRTRLFVALGVVAVVALAACGGSSGSSSSKKSTTTTAAKGPPVVNTASNSNLGTILVDSQGMTLYTLTNAGQPVPCTGACLAAWPPLLLPAGTTTANGGPGVKGLGTVAVSGGQQVTYNGVPLHKFAGDSGAGQANGNGINSFGGTWNVVTAGGGTQSPSTTSGGSTGGGGY
jgi:predicted lipoprotein with Yx(FWY)xxD motif